MINEIKLMVRTVTYRMKNRKLLEKIQQEANQTKTTYHLKWITSDGSGAFQDTFKYTVPNKISNIGEWHQCDSTRIELCNSGFHCSDINHIENWRPTNVLTPKLYIIEAFGDSNAEEEKITLRNMRVIKQINPDNMLEEISNSGYSISENIDFIKTPNELIEYFKLILSREDYLKIKNILDSNKLNNLIINMIANGEFDYRLFYCKDIAIIELFIKLGAFPNVELIKNNWGNIRDAKLRKLIKTRKTTEPLVQEWLDKNFPVELTTTSTIKKNKKPSNKQTSSKSKKYPKTDKKKKS